MYWITVKNRITSWGKGIGSESGVRGWVKLAGLPYVVIKQVVVEVGDEDGTTTVVVDKRVADGVAGVFTQPHGIACVFADDVALAAVGAALLVFAHIYAAGGDGDAVARLTVMAFDDVVVDPDPRTAVCHIHRIHINPPIR